LRGQGGLLGRSRIGPAPPRRGYRPIGGVGWFRRKIRYQSRSWRRLAATRSSEQGRRIMDAAYISAVSALAGSVIGGLTTGFTTLLTQRSQARAGMVAHDLARREDLIRDFIVSASKTYGDALVNSEPRMPELVDLYAMVSRMRVLGMLRTTSCADVVMRAIVDAYFAPNRTVADLRELVKTGQGVDPLKDFSEAARDELRAVGMV
jgi:hypothetical protein